MECLQNQAQVLPLVQGVEPPSTPLRAAQKVLGPPGGSPGEGVVSKDWCSDIDLWYRDWQNFLNSKTIKSGHDSFFSNGLRMFMAAYEERVLTKELYDFIIELCFTDDDATTITRLKTDKYFKERVIQVHDMHEHLQVGTLLLRTIENVI